MAITRMKRKKLRNKIKAKIRIKRLKELLSTPTIKYTKLEVLDQKEEVLS